MERNKLLQRSPCSIGWGFCLKPAIAFQNNSVHLRVYCKELVLFKHEVLGLPIGRKTGLRLPDFVTSSRQRTARTISCLYDTDGSVKIRRDKSGDYPRISFGQKHPQLFSGISDFLASIRITCTTYRNDYFDERTGKMATRWFLDINGFRNFDIFVSEIGTQSPYVIDRIKVVEELRSAVGSSPDGPVKK